MTADEILEAVTQAPAPEREQLAETLMRSYNEPDKGIVEGLLTQVIVTLDWGVVRFE